MLSQPVGLLKLTLTFLQLIFNGEISADVNFFLNMRLTLSCVRTPVSQIVSNLV